MLVRVLVLQIGLGLGLGFWIGRCWESRASGSCVRAQSKAALRFLVDGERVQGDATPRSLQLTDGDQVDVLLEQCGD